MSQYTRKFDLNLFFLSLFLLTSLISCKAPGNQDQQKNVKTLFNNVAEVDAVIDHFVEEGLYPVMYARLEDKNGAVLYEHGNINNDMFPGSEVTKDSWFRIWSMSKIITISLALDLVEDGAINLDDPVSMFIPEFKDLKVAVNMDGESLIESREEGDQIEKCPIKLVKPERDMSILDLINHKAGFYYATTGMPCLDELMSEIALSSSKSNQEFIDKLATLPLVQHPGTQYFYGLNTTVLGFVIERASGKSLKLLVKERITDPMQIEGLQYHLPKGEFLIPPVSGKDTVLRLAHKGELDIFGGEIPTYDPNHSLFLGGEGMVATADGYTDFVRMLLNGGSLNGHQFLNPASIKDMHSPHTQLDNTHGYNGYNLWVSSDSLRIKGHGDSGLWIGGGYEGTHFWADPKRELVGVFMTQINWIQPDGYEKDGIIRGALYNQILDQ